MEYMGMTISAALRLGIWKCVGVRACNGLVRGFRAFGWRGAVWGVDTGKRVGSRNVQGSGAVAGSSPGQVTRLLQAHNFRNTGCRSTGLLSGGVPSSIRAPDAPDTFLSGESVLGKA